MLQKPNTVLIGKKVNTAGTGIATGDIVVINAETGAVIPVADITAAKLDKLQIGVVLKAGASAAESVIKKSNVIDRNLITSLQAAGETAYSAPAEANADVDFTTSTFKENHRYVVRVIYTDLYEHPGQFTHTYEVFAEAGETGETMAQKFVKAVNRHKGARVVASNATAKLTLTAKSIAGTVGLLPNQKFTQVQIGGVAVYFTDPSSFSNSGYSQVPGAKVQITAAKPGKGNPYIVKDREYESWGYDGVTNRTEWPVRQPESLVNMAAEYRTLTIEFGRMYQSPDNQYVKRTECAAEVYCEADLEALRTAIAKWGEAESGTKTGN